MLTIQQAKFFFFICSTKDGDEFRQKCSTFFSFSCSSTFASSMLNRLVWSKTAQNNEKEGKNKIKMNFYILICCIERKRRGNSLKYDWILLLSEHFFHFKQTQSFFLFTSSSCSEVFSLISSFIFFLFHASLSNKLAFFRLSFHWLTLRFSLGIYNLPVATSFFL